MKEQITSSPEVPKKSRQDLIYELANEIDCEAYTGKNLTETQFVALSPELKKKFKPYDNGDYKYTHIDNEDESDLSEENVNRGASAIICAEDIIDGKYETEMPERFMDKNEYIMTEYNIVEYQGDRFQIYEIKELNPSFEKDDTSFVAVKLEK